MSSMTDKKTFKELGYAVVDLKLREPYSAIRKQLTELFSVNALAHGLPAVRSDQDVIRLYRSEHKHVWESAYNQFKQLPEVHGHINNPILMEFLKANGVKIPVLGAPLVVRSNFPDDDDYRFLAHQDYPYNRGSKNAVTVWMPLQDIDASKGALQVIPGTHDKGVYPTKSLDNRPGIRLQEAVATEFPEDQWMTVDMKAGEALVFSQHLVHRSGFNRSSGILYSLQFRYCDLSDAEWANRNYATAFA